MKLTINELMSKPYTYYKNVGVMVNLTFDDGVTKELTPGMVVINRFIFDLIRRSNFKKVYKSTYCITNNFVNGFFSSSTVNKSFESIMNDMIVYIGIDNPEIQTKSLELYNIMYSIINDIYNILNVDFISGITSINIIDLLEIESDTRLQESIKLAKQRQTGKSIQDVHNVLDDILMNDKKYITNPLARLYIAGVVSKGQVKQLLGIRGFITEIDSTIFKKPVLNSFTSGLSNMYEMAIESRSAAFALTSSTDSIKQSEYLSRELQLAAMYLEHIVPGDCGTTELVNFYVTPPDQDYKGDLPNLLGAYYKMKPSDPLKILTMKDTHIIGKNILLRNVLKCKTPDKHSVCSVCFGGLSFNVPHKANLGHLTSTNMSQAASQALLSTKHIIGSAISSVVGLDEITNKVFEVRGNGYAFKKDMFKYADNIKMLIPQSQCNGLKEIRDIAILNKINFEKLSLISELTIVIEKNGETEAYPCTILQGGKYGSLTKKLLTYVAKNGIKVDENDNVVLDITKFRSTATVIVLQEKEYSFYTLIKEIRSKIKTRNILKGGKSSESPEALLSSLFMLVNRKLNINIANLSGLVYTYMAAELETGNFDLGRGSKDPQLISLINAIDRRSASASFGYNAITKKLFRPFMFTTENKPSHPLDALYYKEETVDEFKDNYENV